VVFPNRMRTTVTIWCPITRVASKMDDGNTVFGDSPGNIRNDLLNEREEADIPLANNMKLHRSIARVFTPLSPWERVAYHHLRPSCQKSHSGWLFSAVSERVTRLIFKQSG